MNQTELKVPPESNAEKLDQNSNDPLNVIKPSPYANYVYALTAYYTLLVLFSLWLLVDTMTGGQHIFLNFIGFSEVKPDHLIRTIVFVATGSLLGNALYQIRQLYKAHCKPKTSVDSFNPRWLGKYLSAPWEAIGLALIIVALIGGNMAEVELVGGIVPETANQKNYPSSHLSAFGGFGLGGLLGFGIREVVGWLGDITTTMFPTKNKN